MLTTLKAESKRELQREKSFKSTCHETNFLFFNVVLFVSETKGKIPDVVKGAWEPLPAAWLPS